MDFSETKKSLIEIENKIKEMEENIVTTGSPIKNNQKKQKKPQQKEKEQQNDESTTTTISNNLMNDDDDDDSQKQQKSSGSKKQTSTTTNVENSKRFQWRLKSDPTPTQFNDIELEKQTKEWLERLFSMENNAFLRMILETQLRGAIHQKSTLTDSALVKELFDFLTWERSVVMLKEEWKDSVTLSKFKGLGFKIDAHKAHVPSDDIIYQKNPLLQEYLPRGLVLLRNSNDSYELALFANRKFFGRKSGGKDINF